VFVQLQHTDDYLIAPPPPKKNLIMNGNVTPTFACSMATVSYQLFFLVVVVSKNIITSNKDTGTFM